MRPNRLASMCAARKRSSLSRSTAEPAHTVSFGGMNLMLDKNGNIAGIGAGAKTWAVSGTTILEGCKVQGTTKVERAGETILSFTRMLADTQGHKASVTDTYAPNDKGGVR